MTSKNGLFTSSLFLSILCMITIPLSYWLYASGYDLANHRWFMNTFNTRQEQEMFGILSRLGQAGFQIIVCLGMFFFYYIRSQYDMAKVWLYSNVVFLGAGIICFCFKTLIGRPRPKMSSTMYDFAWFETTARMHSYPSGHTVTTFAWLACLLPFYPRLIGIAMTAFAVTVSMSRVGIGSHYLGDVVFGATLGYVVGTLWYRKWQFWKN